MTITYRLVKGSPLTFAEEDGNFSDLDGRLSTVEGAGFSNPIDSITISGNILTFEYSTSVGGGSDSVAIPTAAWNGRGEWQALTSYAVNDLVIDASRLYLGQTEAATLSDTTYTLQGTDDLKYYRCTGTSTAGVTVITIPSNDEVSIPIDSEITFRQCADPLTLEAVTGVTLNPPAAGVTNIGDVFTIKKVDTDEWDFIGPNAEATA
jgi:hypothetical protein